jgi:hypothetical protein
MEPGGSLPHSQVSATCPYPDTIPFKIFVFWEMHFYSIYTSVLVVGTTRVRTFLSSLLNWIYSTVSFKRRRPSDSLWAGGSVERMPLGARFSALVQTGCGPIQTPIQWKIGVKQSGRVFHNPLPFCAENKEKVQLYFYPLSGFSWTLLQCIFFTWHNLKEIDIIWKGLWTSYQYLRTNYQYLWTNYQYLSSKKKTLHFHCFLKAATHDGEYGQQNIPWQSFRQGFELRTRTFSYWRKPKFTRSQDHGNISLSLIRA